MRSTKITRLNTNWLPRTFKNAFMIMFILLLLSFFALNTFLIAICPKIEHKPPVVKSEHVSSMKSNCMKPDDPSICRTTSCWDSLFESDTMTGPQFIQYLLWTNQTSCLLAYDFGGAMLGSFNGNPPGYDGQRTVCMDKKVRINPKRCLVYSFGINIDWSFDDQMELYGCHVFSFDPSINAKPHNHGPAVYFYDWGLSHFNGNGTGKKEGWKLMTLSTIYDELSQFHGNNKTIDYLKIDIEFDEWLVIPEIIKSGMLSKVLQLTIEFHLNSNESIVEYREKAKILRSLENLGMVRFNSKYNVWVMCDFHQLKIKASCAYEIVWYNSKLQRPVAQEQPPGFVDLLNV